TLFSLDAGRTLRPFEVPVEAHVDPFQVYLAVRQDGYWAEGFVLLSAGPSAMRDRAGAALAAGVARMRAGIRRGEVARAIADGLGVPHPMTLRTVVSVGLSLDEASEDDEPLIAGEVLSLRAGLRDRAGAAIVSAMLAVHQQGSEILWQSP